MRRQKSSRTQPEEALAAELERRGFRVERNAADLPGRPDLVLRRRRIAIFVHGCFWHGCPRHGTVPKHNREWWKIKIERNRIRDRRRAQQLRRQGWSVLQIWEHQDTERAGERIQKWSRRLSARS